MNSRRFGGVTSTGERRPEQGKPLTVPFELDGQKFTALNGGPVFQFNEAVSFVVRCDSKKLDIGELERAAGM